VLKEQTSTLDSSGTLF